MSSDSTIVIISAIALFVIVVAISCQGFKADQALR